MKIWTEAYSPFIIGGNVNQPIATDIAVGEELPLGKGFSGYLVVNPITSQTHVVCATSGAFVGTSIEEVKNDINACDDVAFMNKQIAGAVERAKEARMLASDEFWKRFKT